MNRKIKITAIALMSLMASLQANEQVEEVETPVVKSQHGYIDIGLGPFPVPLPVFGLGYRLQSGHHGFDMSLQASTIVFYTQVKATPLYLYYLKPNLKSQYYLGGGVGVSGLFENKRSIHKSTLLLSPEFVVGKQYEKEAGASFMQMQLSFPTHSFAKFSEKHFTDHHTLWMPLVVFSYGIMY